MTVHLSPPGSSDSRSSYADWLEFQALLSSTGRSTLASLFSVLEITDDIRESVAPHSDGASFDEAISERPKDHIASITFEELDYRRSALGSDYPFKIEHPSDFEVVLTLDAKWATQPGNIIYLFCLFVSAIRESKFQPRTQLKALEAAIGNKFQICACLAAGGYLGGDVSSFGFPRANGLAFLPALRKTFERFGAGKVKDTIEPGMPEDLKDGGIDVIAWREQPDKMPGKLYLIGQSASGAGWEKKSVIEYIGQLTSWFTHPPQKHSFPAMFIPFTFHALLDEPSDGSFSQALRTRFWYEEQRFGIIFDRIRITHFASLCLSMSDTQKSKIDGALLYSEICRWLIDALDATALENAA